MLLGMSDTVRRTPSPQKYVLGPKSSALGFTRSAVCDTRRHWLGRAFPIGQAPASCLSISVLRQTASLGDRYSCSLPPVLLEHRTTHAHMRRTLRQHHEKPCTHATTTLWNTHSTIAMDVSQLPSTSTTN